MFGLIVMSLVATGYARADIEPSNTVVSGFGTLGGIYSSNEKYGLVRDIGQETPPGRQFSWRTDTRLGVQVAHTFNQQWLAVGQVVVRDQAEQTLNNLISRAFISYRPDTNLHLRVGRMADATFLMSDYLDVGYVYPWVRAPMESYGVMAPRFYDGMDVTYSIPDSAGIWRIKGLAGQMKAAVPTASGENYMVESNDLWGVALLREQGPLKVRIGYTTLHLKNSGVVPSQLTSGLNQVIASCSVFCSAIADEATYMRDTLASLEGARVSYASAGISYDDGLWVAQVEVSDLSSSTKLFPKGQQGHASLGYRFGDFTPYVKIGGSRSPDAAKIRSSWAALGPGAVNLQNGILVAMNTQRSAQSSLSLGMRWDFDSRAAFKLQWDHVRVREHGWGVWTAPVGDDGAAGRANLLSATIDFVF